jgi:thiamine kinase-like enzyme
MADDEATTPILLDKINALRLVSSFFTIEWASTDLSVVHTKQVTGGLINSLQLIWRDNAAITEPSAVLIRHFGRSGEIEEPPSTSTTLSAAQQAIVHWEMSRKGWGPRVYGFFAGGRLEEYYVDSHTLTSAESMQPALRRDVARAYARLHSLRLPLRRDGFQLILREYVESARSNRADVVASLRAVDHPVAKQYAAMFETTDWFSELEWVAGLFEKQDCKITVTHGDTNYLNILVKPDATSDSRIVLIDYETVCYSYRGFDIGGHFTERMYCYSQTDSQLTGYSAPDAEEQRVFCEVYLDELRALGEALSERDTVKQLLLEASIGRLWHSLFVNMMCTMFDEVELDPLFLAALMHMMETYWQLKEEFVERESENVAALGVVRIYEH